MPVNNPPRAQDYDNAHQDLQTIEDVVNGADDQVVTSRLGRAIRTLANAIDSIVDGTAFIAKLFGVNFQPLYADLKGKTGTDGTAFRVAGRAAARDGGGGTFIWDASDLSAQVENDTAEIIYVAPNSDPTGESGAWVRDGATRGSINVFWAGARGSSVQASAVFASLEDAQAVYPHCVSLNDFMDWLAVQSVLNTYPGRLVWLPGLSPSGYYYWNRRVDVTVDSSGIVGDGIRQTNIYHTSSAQGGIYCGPSDIAATEYINGVVLEGFRLLNTASNPTGIGLEVRQCGVSICDKLRIFGFLKGCLSAGGIGNVYTRMDIRHDPTDTAGADDYNLMVISSDRGGGTWQAAYSHEFAEIYLSAGGVVGGSQLDATVKIGTGDGLHFVNCYWKLGKRGLVLVPDESDISIRVDFTNVYLDGWANTEKAFHVPAFNNAGASVRQVTFQGGLIANAMNGKLVVIETPVAGSLGTIRFDAVPFGDCKDEMFDVSDTARTLTLKLTDCSTRGGAGGIKVNSINALVIDTIDFNEMRNTTGIAHVALSGTINSAIILGNHITRHPTIPAPTFSNSATIGELIMDNNGRSSGIQWPIGYQASIANDAVLVVPVTLAAGEYATYELYGYATVANGRVFFRTDGSTRSLDGLISVVNNTALTGTSGSSSAVTVSFASGNLYIENRTGATLPLQYRRVY